MRVERDSIVFSSGRVVRANNGIIGLGPDLELYGGYDSGLACGWADDGMFPEDIIELADHMAKQWERVAAEAAGILEAQENAGLEKEFVRLSKEAQEAKDFFGGK